MLHNLLKTLDKEQKANWPLHLTIFGVCLQCYTAQCHWLPAIQVNVWSQSTNYL